MCNKLYFFLWHCGPVRVMTSYFLTFLDHTQGRTTVGRTSLGEGSARRRDLYLHITQHSQHTDIHFSFTGFETAIPPSERPQVPCIWPHGQWDLHNENLLIVTGNIYRRNVIPATQKLQKKLLRLCISTLLRRSFKDVRGLQISVGRATRRQPDTRRASPDLWLFYVAFRHTLQNYSLRSQCVFVCLVMSSHKPAIFFHKKLFSLLINPFTAYWLKYVTPGLTFKNSTYRLHCIYMFCVDLSTNSYYIPIQH